MIGHDIVPHSDISNGENISFTSTTDSEQSEQIAKEHSELGHIFEYFQHSSTNSTLKYISGNINNFDFKNKTLQNAALTVDIDDQFIWHTNFEKQRFRDYPILPYFSTISSHTLRGPPSC
tara:strand:+ start:1599 stop:1958 length:360 start_codon:yes stop_codon:yes gene_type:complete